MFYLFFTMYLNFYSSIKPFWHIWKKKKIYSITQETYEKTCLFPVEEKQGRQLFSKRIKKTPPAMLFINNTIIHWISKWRQRIERAPARSLHKPQLYTETKRSCLFWFYNLLLLFIKDKNGYMKLSTFAMLRGSIHFKWHMTSVHYRSKK